MKHPELRILAVVCVIISYWSATVCAAKAEAQTRPEKSEANRRVSIVPTIGVNLSRWLNAEGSLGLASTSYRPGYALSLSAKLDQQMTRHTWLGVVVGGAFIEKGTFRKFENSKNTEFRLSYLEAPIGVRGEYAATERVYAHVTFDLRPGVLVGADRVDVNGNIMDQGEDYDRLNVGWSLTVGASMSVKTALRLIATAGFSEDISNIDSESDDSGTRHRSAQLMLGIDWELWKSF